MKKLRIMFLDIECTDLNADIGHIVCIDYKFNDENKVHHLGLLDYPGKDLNDDSKLLKAFEPAYEQADLIVHQFGDFYDLPFIRTRRLIHGMLPMPEVKTVDTWRIAKKKLKFGSNRLERFIDALDCPYKKTPISLKLWQDARIGKPAAFKYIHEHCKNDVLSLEWVYNKFAALWPAHPVLVTDPTKCRLCGSSKNKSNGRRLSENHIYQRRQCLSCGHTWRGQKIVN